MLFFLFATGLVAGTVDAIAGGGGLISLPILLSTGMPPHIAFGTSKLQAIVGTFTATKRYYQRGFISFKKVSVGLLAGFIGSTIGAITAQILSSQILQKTIPILLAFVLIYTLTSPKLGKEDQSPRVNITSFYILAGFILGFYDGFFGPGVGAIWIFLLTYFMGYNLIKATAYTKALNLNSSIIATLCFVVGGNVDYRIALCMAAGQILGARLGTHLAIKKGAQVIRPIFLAIVTTTIGVLIYRSYTSTEDIIFSPPLIVCALVAISAMLIYRYRASHR